ncbi:MAG TPA: CBS domain-containing protein [Polyangiaceae bacterium]|nr:CBS domain-containing protein [Polyangiaceae bacterium]
MTRDVTVVLPELSLKTAWAIMRREHIRHLPVVRGGVLLGILSDRDVLLHATPGEGYEPEVPDKLVGEAMTPAPMICEPSTPVTELVKTMIERKIDAVPVMSAGDKLVGLVTTTDLLALLLTSDEARPLPFAFRVREAREGEA